MDNARAIAELAVMTGDKFESMALTMKDMHDIMKQQQLQIEALSRRIDEMDEPQWHGGHHKQLRCIFHRQS